jgi:CheY-like chemotaxis protein
MEGEKERLIKIGANAFLSKPFLKRNLYKTICAALNLQPLASPAPVRKPDGQPQHIAHVPPAPRVAAGAKKPAVTPRGDLSILVVDDNRANQHLLYSQLKSLGLHADIATDGKVGLDLWHRKQHRIVFTDCSMPIMNGFEMTRGIRKLEASDDESSEAIGKPALIIAVTGSPEEFRERCRAAGMDDILAKPLLLQSLNQILVKHRAII